MAPYRHDGHTDHDALGAAAAEAAGAGGHGLLEYPIWYWLWADAADPAWQSWLRLPLDPAERQAKAAAMASHTTQVRALSGQPGDEVLLPPAFLAHFERPFETFAWQRPAAGAGSGGSYAAADAEGVFDAVHAGNDDPWQYTTSWYEQRKRSLTLAALPGLNYTAGSRSAARSGRSAWNSPNAAPASWPSTRAAPRWPTPPGASNTCPQPGPATSPSRRTGRMAAST